MIAVAVVAAVTALWILDDRTTRRRSALRPIMMNHMRLAGAHRGEPVGRSYTDEQIRVLNAHLTKPDEVMAAYHDKLWRVYRHACEHPSDPVPPDPPPPR